jgi:hypothetical protein
MFNYKIYSKQVEKDKLYLKAVKEKDYEEIINDDKDTIK